MSVRLLEKDIGTSPIRSSPARCNVVRLERPVQRHEDIFLLNLLAVYALLKGKVIVLWHALPHESLSIARTWTVTPSPG
jgi:hypothetical protein